MRQEIQKDISTIKRFKVYKWMYKCKRCLTKLPVVSYYFHHEHFHCIGDVLKLDKELMRIYSFIEEKYDKSQGRKLITNWCPHCELIIGNKSIAVNIAKKLIPKGLQIYEDALIQNDLILMDLKTNKYEKYGLDSQQVKALKDIEEIIGFTIVAKKRITSFLPGIIIENNQVIGLSLSYCNLQSFPESICNLTQLKKLNLSFNGIKSIPECFKKLEHLNELDLSRNPLFPFPEVITQLKSIKKLKLIINSFTKIPESIGNLTSLEDLAIHRFAKISPLPKSLWNLTSLKRLSIKGSRIGEIPESIGNLKSLEYLLLDSKDLNSLPESISKLKLLKEFNFSYKESMDIPESVQKIVKRMQKPKVLIKIKKTYSDSVEIEFKRIKMDPKLCIKDNDKIQREEIHKWEWEDTKWEKLDEDIVFTYDEIYVIPSVEVSSSNRPLPRWLYIKRIGGIRVKDLKEAYYKYLPNYGDYHFFELFEYMYDYDKIPVYYLFIGS